MSDETKSDLTFATLDELVHELCNRHEALIFVGIQKTGENGTNYTDTNYKYHGTLSHVLGLAEYGKLMISARMTESFTDGTRNDG